MKEKFYVTTPIYYPNDVPHIGHAYTTIAADIIARWNKLQGKEVFFLTGTDDHGKKIANAAKKAGKTPKQFTDDLIPEFKSAWKKLNIDYDKFIRTTDTDHQKVVQKVLQKCFDKGDIYKGEYEGLYCTECEAYYTEKDLEDGCCPIHKKPIENLKEETYFFKLSNYQDKLLKFYEENPNFISPKHRKQEIINRVKEGLRDLSISRTSFDWGVPLPFDKSHVAYVWFDALFNYYSATQKKDKKKFWPTDLHIIGKDIFWFHTVYWPAFLMSAGIKLPKQVFAHGWWTFNKEKISKSRGKVIGIDELIKIAGVDSARYFLFREASFGEDGDFSRKSLIDRHNNELADKLGNLVSRVSGLIEKSGCEESKKWKLPRITSEGEGYVNKYIKNLELHKALNAIFIYIDATNKWIQEKKPWGIKNESEKKAVLYNLKREILKLSKLLSPFIPDTAEKIQKIFKTNKIKKAPILFQKIETQKPNKHLNQTISKESEARENLGFLGKQIPNKTMENVSTIQFEDFTKLDLRVAQIENAENIEGADKLYKLSLDVGELGKRTICAGIKEFYKADDLKGKKIIIIANLAPRKLRGIESQGMLLAASSKEGSPESCPSRAKKTLSLISPDQDIASGSTVG
ncbi:methionine--tRNA ligase [archaeon]|nr:methionine--tRNA ligase [archaeon]